MASELFDDTPTGGSLTESQPLSDTTTKRSKSGTALLGDPKTSASSSTEPGGAVPLMASPTTGDKHGEPLLPERIAEAPTGQGDIFAGEGVRFDRWFTKDGEDVFDTTEWDYRTSVISGEGGAVVFEQKDVEIPKAWSMLATNVVVSKYFRGKVGTPGRETSVKQLISRVADTIYGWGKQGNYFETDADADVFHAELKYLLLHQYMAFNSPVWFNLGVPGERPQVSACFINSVEDTMESILTLAKTEGMLFKWGSGTGTNLSVLRSSQESLKGGGTASGPVSFMRGFDAFAGAIKCVTPDTYVHTDTGMRTVGELISPDLAPGFHENTSVVLATKDEPTRISHVYVSPKAPTYRLRLRHSNLSLRGTAEHPVMVLTPEFRLEWKRLSDVQSGDHVAVSRRTELWPDAAPSFAGFAPVSHHAEKQLTYPQTMTPELARLLGYMVSEGSMDAERFRFLNADPEVFADFLHCVEAVFGVAPTKNVSSRAHPTTGVVTQLFEACWTNAVRFLEYVGLTTANSAEKMVPWSVRQSPRDLVAQYLRAYFEGDGHISNNIYAASASEQLLRETQLLLLNMGMVGHLRPHPVNGVMYWNLYLRGEQAWQFAREVGFVSARKQAAAECLGDKNANANIDTIPYLVDLLRARTSSNGNVRCADGATRFVGFGFFNRKPGSRISYTRLRNTPGLADKLRVVEPEWADTLEAITQRDFFWDAAQTVTREEDAVTYDFTVPETHSFVGNGIINHNSGGKTRRAAKMTILNSDHPDIEEFVECKADAERKAHALIEAGFSGAFNVPNGAYDSVFFQNANHSVRGTDDFMRAVELDREWSTREVLTGTVAKTFRARALMRKMAEATWVCGDPGMQFDTTANRWHTCPNTGRINASNPCSEFFFLDDTACNLASLNLMKFRGANREFDVEMFRHAVRITTTAQEIMVGNAAYPTDKITINSHDYRPLGLGYANLGALLMARGLAYDSDEGRAYAAAITAILSGEGYTQSAKIARRVGAFAGYEKNRQPMTRVMQMHRDHVEAIDKQYVPDDMIKAARKTWDVCLDEGAKYGYRNAQISVLAPTGTIGFMMDCDTTGVEPDIAIVKFKSLVGGGFFKIVNQTVPEALERLGYSASERKAILDYIEEKDTIEGAPGLADEHLSVFDCAFRAKNGVRSIHYMGHIKMMAAVQPFISGAISKTVNMPHDATPDDIAEAYLEAWKLGTKALAIYRDGSKKTQPLSTGKTETPAAKEAVATVEFKPFRRKLPDERASLTHKFSVGGHEGYITIGTYPDGQVGEIFVTMSKEGSVVSGLMDSFATAISLSLQYGVPLKTLVDKFMHTRFEPSGFTGNPDIPMAKSIMDYLFRYMALKFLDKDERANVGLIADEKDDDYGDEPMAKPVVASPAPVKLATAKLVRPALGVTAPPAPSGTATSAAPATETKAGAAEREVFVTQADAPPCPECGSITTRNGACYRCANCGTSIGCS